MRTRRSAFSSLTSGGGVVSFATGLVSLFVLALGLGGVTVSAGGGGVAGAGLGLALGLGVATGLEDGAAQPAATTITTRRNARIVPPSAWWPIALPAANSRRTSF